MSGHATCWLHREARRLALPPAMALSPLLPRGLAIILLAAFSSALHITPGSSCSSVCGNSLETLPSDVVCNDFDYYSTSAGATFMDCIQCLQTSNTTADSEDDVSWFLCKHPSVPPRP